MAGSQKTSGLFFSLSLSVVSLHFLFSFLQTTCIASLAHVVGKMVIKRSGALYFSPSMQRDSESVCFSFSLKILNKELWP